MTKKFILDYITKIPDCGPKYSLVTTSITSKGTGLFLFILKSDTNRNNKRKTPTPKLRTTFRLVIIKKDEHLSVDIENVNFDFTLVDVFPDGRILMVASRCEWRSRGDFDLNGLIYNPKTKERSYFLAGDGVANIGIDDSGKIWISYFDEGVFGNLGWDHPVSPPIGKNGLNLFNARGEIIWKYESPEGGPYIDDCYAMNISPIGNYIYFYSDFPLCSIGTNFELEFWKTDLNGCGSFAIDYRSVLFSNQYGEKLSQFHHLSFTENKLSKYQDIEVVLPDGELINGGQVISRGAFVHFIDGKNWYCGDISKI